jgi:undecaprenyl-diphosphatase
MSQEDQISETDERRDVEAPAGQEAHERRERRRAVLRLWRAETAYGAALAAFAVLALFAYFNAYFGWDLRVARAVQSLDAPFFAGFMRDVSRIGSGLVPWVLTSVVALLFLAFGRRSEMAGLILSAGVGQAVNRLFKVLIARPRPAADLVQVHGTLNSESFPSGHVSFYVGFFGFLFFVAYALLERGTWYRRVALTVAALPIALVGLSRVYLGAHWPSDTLGAYLLSGLWLAFCLHLYRRWKARATFHQDEAPVENPE